MSLYYEAAKIIENNVDSSKSLRDIVYRSKDIKTSQPALFALLSETLLWSSVLSRVVEQTELLRLERKLTPALAILLSHDLLLAKKGLATNKSHQLHLLISKHKARLSAELTRLRIRGGHASLEAWRNWLLGHDQKGIPEDSPGRPHSRWFRVNTLKTTTEDCLDRQFGDYSVVQELHKLNDPKQKCIYRDVHVPHLFAVRPDIDLTRTEAYRKGHVILQDKASCFPAHLLNPNKDDRHIIDGCAAPGNKTTHLASIVHAVESEAVITACERAKDRAETLKTMVHKAGADKIVTVKAGQDFLALEPSTEEFRDVTAILLDPSCSGSGIVGRDDGEGASEKAFRVVLPKLSNPAQTDGASKGKKRKREVHAGQDRNGTKIPSSLKEVVQGPEGTEVVESSDTQPAALEERLRALSVFQLKLLLHAFRFPNVRRVTYSTCSIHAEENEHVVIKALSSGLAVARGWRIMKRQDQVEGLRIWPIRGDATALAAIAQGQRLVAREQFKLDEVAEACIRCKKGDEYGTMGFFVAGFVRETDSAGSKVSSVANGQAVEEEEWQGFSD